MVVTTYLGYIGQQKRAVENKRKLNRARQSKKVQERGRERKIK